MTMLGPEANELVLFDQAKLFSSTYGWGPILGRLFPRGLMLLDFEEHRLHRRAFSVAFKSGPMSPISARWIPALRPASRSGKQTPDLSCCIPR